MDNAGKQFLEILPFVFVITLILGAVAWFIFGWKNDRVESELESKDTLDLEISKIRELQRRKL